MNKEWYVYLLWPLGAAVLGFGIAAIFAGFFRLPRPVYLIPYVIMVSLFFYAFMRWSGLSILNLLRHNWYWGVIGAVLVGVFTVRNILSQPASTRAEGLPLVFELLWVGVVYGLVDAVLLSVLPAVATWQGFSSLGWTASLPGKIAVGG